MKSILNGITAKRYLIMMNLFVLAVHTSLVFLFSFLHVTLMVYVNICSVLCYCVCFILVKKEQVTGYILLTYVEILLHTVLAILSVGSGLGFQLYFIASIATVLFAQYFSVHLGIKKHLNGPLLSAICVIMYVFMLILDRFHESWYVMSDNASFSCTVLNSVLVFGSVVLFFSILTGVASDNEVELSMQATHDNLTGLINRHYLTKYMIDIHQTENLVDYWIAILDIDDFKQINDQHGHLCGDFVLRSMAEIIKKCCNDCIVCRWGGEEFMIVGPNPEQNNDMIISLLEEVRSTIASNKFVYNDNTKLDLTVTIGVARYRDGQTLDAWVNLADTRLYIGKQTGKNQIISAGE